MNRIEQTCATSMHTTPDLDSIFAGPFPCRRLVSRAVGLVDMCDFGDERVVRVGVREHGADAQ